MADKEVSREIVDKVCEAIEVARTTGKIRKGANEATKAIEKAYKHWQKQKAKGLEIAFNSDFLVSHGFKHLLLGAHFRLKRGINQLIERHASEEIKDSWQGVT